ncbi:MAG: 23S rRNA pseudouridine(1911/1915/1917) synthase RluD [Acidiferrobacterales bacterium]
MTLTSETILSASVPPEYAGQRLDQALTGLFPDFSRSQIQKWIRSGQVQVDSELPRARDRVRGGEAVRVSVQETPTAPWQPEAIPLDILYEDEHLLVIDKPAGLVVHPAAGNWAGTLLNALLGHDPALRHLARAGIVHRLDKETSGLLVVARSERARRDLIDQLSHRTLEREYLAIVCGIMVAGGTVDAPIGRHRVHRTRMAVSTAGKSAVSHFRVEARYRAHTLLRVKLESGRTHQIRVHMAHLQFPILGDPVYGGRLQIPRDSSGSFAGALRLFRRQALHATRLGLVHPVTGETMHWTSPMPADMGALVAALESDMRAHARASHA